MKRIIALVVAGLLISSCAPLMLLRTPKPVEAGRLRGGLSVGYGLPLVPVPPCFDETGQPGPGCPFEGRGPAYEPITTPVQIDIAQGIGNGGELDWTIHFGILPGLRLGYKRLVLDGPVLLALDVGGSIYALNFGLDLGLLGSIPLDGWEPYFGLRGFFTLGHSGTVGQGFITGAITAGASIGGDFGVYVELTLATQGFNSLGAGSPAWRQSVPAVGWVLVPAIGFRF